MEFKVCLLFGVQFNVISVPEANRGSTNLVENTPTTGKLQLQASKRTEKFKVDNDDQNGDSGNGE